MKSCTECGEHKALDEFYALGANRSGRMGKCKVCWRAQVRERRRTNPAVQAYDRARAKTPARKAHARAIVIKWRREHPEAYKAETAVGNAIRDGRLDKGAACQVAGCDRTDVHAHHHDYSKPLEVKWFCPLHHHRLHAEHGDFHG